MPFDRFHHFICPLQRFRLCGGTLDHLVDNVLTYNCNNNNDNNNENDNNNNIIIIIIIIITITLTYFKVFLKRFYDVMKTSRPKCLFQAFRTLKKVFAIF